MDDSLDLSDKLDAGFTARPSVQSTLGLQGVFTVRCYDEEGELKWQEEFSNLITNVGLDHALDVTLSAATQSTSWYLGLVDGSSSPTFAAGDTMGSHTGWTEEQAYDEANRQGWTDGGVSSQSVDNSGSPAAFNYSQASDIAGAFMVDDNTKGGSSGVLFAEGSFSSTRTVGSGDTLEVTYTINAS